jgi:regulator of extracellular matrix RemA (YlzA/DUF370 family)
MDGEVVIIVSPKSSPIWLFMQESEYSKYSDISCDIDNMW